MSEVPHGMTGQFPASNQLAPSEMLPATREALRAFARRRATLQFCRGVAMGATVLIAGMILLALIDHFARPTTLPRILLSLLAYGVAGWVAYRNGIASAFQSSASEVAGSFEVAQTKLRGQVLSAVELSEVDHLNGSPDFRRKLQTHVANELSGIEVRHLLPWKLIQRATFVLFGLLVVIVSLGLIPTLELPRRFARVLLPIAPIQRASLTKIHLIQPNPPSAMVAEGDLVGVVAKIGRLGRSDVWLEIRDDSGEERLRMVRRSADDQSQTDSNESSLPTFSANLPVQQTPVDYRILAGDAETLWYTLTPQPRPRATSFEKEYQYPTHLKLPNEVLTEDHGDLTAFVGTKVTMKVNFDQPVRDAEMRFSSRGTGLALSPNPSNELQFEITVPISTPGSYRIDAIGSDTGLNNPFSPRYTIDPVIDRNPIAMWDHSTPRRQIVSPAAVLSLVGHLEDDVPMDHVIQQILLEGEGVTEIKKSLDSPSRIARVELEWDLACFDGREKPDVTLPSGSRLKTRLIAVDRSGHRGQSNWIDVFIARSDFDPHRHQDLIEHQELSRQITSWLEELNLIAKGMQTSMKEAIDSPDNPSFLLETDLTEQFQSLQTRWESISGFDGEQSTATPTKASPISIRKQLALLNNPVVIDQWAQLDSAANFALQQLSLHYQAWQQIGKQLPAKEFAPERKRLAGSHVGDVRSIGNLTSRSIDFTKAILAIDLAKGVSRDMATVENSARMLGDTAANVPLTRLPGQSELINQQLLQISQLLKSMEPDLPENVNGTHENIHRFIDDRTRMISDGRDRLKTSQDGSAEAPFRHTMRQLANDIESLRKQSLLNGNINNEIAAATKEFAAEPLGWAGQLRSLNRTGKQWLDQSKKSVSIEERGDSNDLTESKNLELFYADHFQRLRETIHQRLNQLELIEESRSDSQVTASADLELISRTLDAVFTEGFVSPENSNLDPVAFFDKVSKAILTLDAGNKLHRFEKQLQFVADRERYSVDLIDAMIQQPIRLKHIQVANEIPMAQIRHVGLDQEVGQQLQNTRWNQDATQARERLENRRWKTQPHVSAAIPVESILTTYRSTWEDLDPMMEEAREFLRDLTPSLSDQAREAAEEAEQQSEAIKEDQTDRPDSPEQVAADAELKFDGLKQQVGEIAEQLADRANNADYSKAEDAQVARDADQAIAAIEEQSEKVASQLRENQPEEASESLSDLSKTLEAIADHFEAVDSGEDTSATRETLNEMAPTSESISSMDNQFDAAESVAKANQMTPEQLLEQLEKKLPTDQPMQESLQDITEKTVRAAEQMIREAANEETSLRRNLERSDAEFSEQKRVARNELRSMSDRANAVRDHLLAMAEQASGWSNESATQQDIQQIRQQLSSATQKANEVQRDDALLEELRAANESLREVVKDAAKQTAKINEKAQKSQKNALHNNEQSRTKAARQLEAIQRRGKNQYLQSLQRANQQWNRDVEEAGRRIQQAQNQERNAQTSLDRAQEKLKKQPDDASAKEEVADKRAQVENARKAANAAKQTRELARQSEAEAKQRFEKARNRTVANLDAENPAAEMLSRVTQQATEELQDLANSLDSVQESLSMEDSLSSPESANKTLADQQERLQQSVAMAAEELRRAARHEERLGNTTSAENLNKVAKDIESVNEQPMSVAQESLQAGKAGQANEQLAEAAAQLQKTAETLAQQTTNASTDPNQSDGVFDGEPSSTQSQKLAKTLDELDRALNSPPPEMEDAQSDSGESKSSQSDSKNQSSDQSSDGQSSEGSPGQPQTDAPSSQQSGQSNSESSTSQPATSGQASSTLAEAAQQAIRNLAQQRQRQLQQIAQAGDPSQPSDQESSQQSSFQANNPATDFSQTQDNSLIDASDWNVTDGDWGELRERQTDEVIQDRKVRIPMTYRKAVQAYFEAVSAEAAKTTSSKESPSR
ncbi:MAG TPA: peptidase [Rhodopirellula baltica]|uniref:Probable IgA-specific metalloendopeptidase n=1 Tax=Rhodopirellula baltica (strain DSM 10527 / NCIMB 13988 / SH1) TaxID=243090 RepID=Q7UQ94_RHOBA|nr:peptidase [Rhodopirellula baltica]CAD74811.1 probable IgA-specific metalloendopeptidase [Rhodopirellula baltica SH 1]HBE62566.1 peptidase [Rhodopirellula baltica]